MKEAEFKGHWKDGKNSVEMLLPVMLFIEDDTSIAYIPILDLSGYGKDEKESIDSLKVVLSEYFSYTVRKNTLLDDLRAHGWTIKKKSKPYIAPELTDLFQKNEYLHEIVNNKSYRMHRMPVNVPQFVA